MTKTDQEQIKSLFGDKIRITVFPDGAVQYGCTKTYDASRAYHDLRYYPSR